MAVREIIADSIKWWEPRRILYNLGLAAVVLLHFTLGYPQTRSILKLDQLLFFFMLAVLANIAYCAAYLCDIFVQMSDLQSFLPKARWAVFGVGVAFALVLAHFWSKALMGIF
jgi:hypothetical protein